MTDTPKTLKAILEASADYLSRHGVEEARLKSELLLARLLNCKRLELALRYGQALGEKHLEAMRRGVKRLAAGEPVQYILGQTEFMGHVFKVDKRALIPRPETELLVEEVLGCASLWEGSPKPLVVDLGTGCGCIAISLALARPQGVYLAVDPSEEAIALARENARALGAGDGVTFAPAELADCLEPEMAHGIAANLPYVRTAEWERLPVHIREHEPRAALDGGASGLEVIETAVQDAAIVLRPGGLIWLEIGADQGRAVSELLEDSGFGQIRVKPDAAGHDRVVSAALLPA